MITKAELIYYLITVSNVSFPICFILSLILTLMKKELERRHSWLHFASLILYLLSFLMIMLTFILI